MAGISQKKGTQLVKLQCFSGPIRVLGLLYSHASFMDLACWGVMYLISQQSPVSKPLEIVQSLSSVWLFATPWTVAHQASLSLTISWSLLKFMFIASVMPSSHLILWRPLLFLLSIIPSVRDFSNESSVHSHITKILELQLQLQHRSFQWLFRVDLS